MINFFNSGLTRKMLTQVFVYMYERFNVAVGCTSGIESQNRKGLIDHFKDSLLNF